MRTQQPVLSRAGRTAWRPVGDPRPLPRSWQSPLSTIALDGVMENQQDLVEIVESLKPLVCVKG